MNRMIISQKFPPTPESFRRQGEAVNKFDGRNFSEIPGKNIDPECNRGPICSEEDFPGTRQRNFRC